MRMPVLQATDVVSAKLRVLGEHYCDFGAAAAGRAGAARADRLAAVRADEVGDNPYARAFLYLLDELGITDAGRSATSADVAPGAAAPAS